MQRRNWFCVQQLAGVPFTCMQPAVRRSSCKSRSRAAIGSTPNPGSRPGKRRIPAGRRQRMGSRGVQAAAWRAGAHRSAFRCRGVAGGVPLQRLHAAGVPGECSGSLPSVSHSKHDTIFIVTVYARIHAAHLMPGMLMTADLQGLSCDRLEYACIGCERLSQTDSAGTSLRSRGARGRSNRAACHWFRAVHAALRMASS